MTGRHQEATGWDALDQRSPTEFDRAGRHRPWTL